MGRILPWSLATVTPSAPGKRPKRLSKLRFSLTMNTTCLIGVAVGNRAASTRAGWRSGGALWLVHAGTHATRTNAPTADRSRRDVTASSPVPSARPPAHDGPRLDHA